LKCVIDDFFVCLWRLSSSHCSFDIAKCELRIAVVVSGRAKMIVIALEGCHGCGKTQIVQAFSNAGFATMDEAFLDMPSYCSLHPQSLLMETNWICGWFQRVLQEASNGHEKKVLIVDRSPLSAVFYTRNNNGALLAPVIAAQVKELREINIEIFTVHVKCETETLWQRVQRRLTQEPERALYKEDSLAWLREVQSFYDNFSGWDFTVENNGDDISVLRNVMKDIIDVVSAKSPKVRDAKRMFFEGQEHCKRLYLDDPTVIG